VIRIAVFLSAYPAIRPSAVSAQCPDGSPPPCNRSPASPALGDRTPSLIVLYLENVSQDTMDVALADGLTEELIARLSQVSGLRVTGRYGALRFRGRRALDPRLVGRELGVRYVMQGTLRHSAERVRVAVEIFDVTTGYNVWGQTYEQATRDVFALQDSVAVQVVEAVRGRLTRQELARLAPRLPTANSDAYAAYLRGTAVVRARTAAAGSNAIAQFRRAVALDTTFAAGYARLAEAYALAAIWGWDVPDAPYDSLPSLAQHAAGRALALDSTSAESWLGAAMAMRFSDPRRSVVLNRRAVALDPSNIEALHQLAAGLRATGDQDSAMATEDRVLERDPYYGYVYAFQAQIANYAGRPLEAAARASRGLAIDSSQADTYRQLADADLQLGRTSEARLVARRALALGARPTATRVTLALADLFEGDTSRARIAVDSMGRESRRRLDRSPGGLPFFEVGYLSAAYAQLGIADSAVAWAQRIVRWDRRFHWIELERSWLWAPVRGDPRFQTLLAESRP
jgi:adenylate cyclase